MTAEQLIDLARNLLEKDSPSGYREGSIHDIDWCQRRDEFLAAARSQPDARAPVQALPDAGWKEAAIAWAVCASIHREYAKGKDPFFKTRQADFVRHEEDAREKALAAPTPGAPPQSADDQTHER